jgi:rhodanese-related sulfurtransferase
MKFILGSKFLTVSIAALTLLSSCRWFAPTKKEVPALVIVNVLDKKYFDDCRIAGSINISMDDIEQYALDNWDKQKTQIITYCGNYKCLASGEAAVMLKKLGFQKVWAYEGGTAEWKHLGYPIEGQCVASGFLNDYGEPEGYVVNPKIPAITAEKLKKKFDEFELNK